MIDPTVVRVLDLLAQHALHLASIDRAGDTVRGVYDYQRDRWADDLNQAMSGMMDAAKATGDAVASRGGSDGTTE